MLDPCRYRYSSNTFTGLRWSVHEKLLPTFQDRKHCPFFQRGTRSQNPSTSGGANSLLSGTFLIFTTSTGSKFSHCVDDNQKALTVSILSFSISSKSSVSSITIGQLWLCDYIRIEPKYCTYQQASLLQLLHIRSWKHLLEETYISRRVISQHRIVFN